MREVATADGTARTRILDAARARLLEAGESGASSAQVAAAAGVSKALVHYHFRDKRELLLGVTTACGERIAGRAGVTTDAASPLDAFWQWLERELNAEDLRLLVQLTQGDDDAVAEAAVGELQVFRVETQRRVRRVFRALALAPSIPVELVTELVVVAAMGLAAGAGAMSDGAGRQTIDVLWLALLGLGA